MRIIHISSVLLLILCSFTNFEAAVIKGVETQELETQESESVKNEATSTVQTSILEEFFHLNLEQDNHDYVTEPESLENDQNNPEIATTPQFSENEKTEATLETTTDSQFPHNEENIDTNKNKRCARPATLGSVQSPTLSLTRRDLSERRIQLCESCRNRKPCKERNICVQCKTICNGIPTTTPLSIINEVELSTRPEEKREITEVPSPTNVDDQPVLTSRFTGNEESNVPKYYSLAAVETGTVMRLMSKIFNIPSNFDKLVILGKKNNGEEEEANILIIDLAQAFGQAKKVSANVQHSENDDAKNDLVNQLNNQFDKVMENRLKETGTTLLPKEETDAIINNALEQNGDNVGAAEETETGTRCSVDKAVDNLIDLMPSYNEPPKRPQYSEPKPVEPHYPELKPIVQPQTYEESSEEEEEIVNPPVIQDNYEMRKNVKEADKTKSGKELLGTAPDDYIDDNEEARLSADETPKSHTISRHNFENRHTDVNKADNLDDENEEARMSVDDTPKPQTILGRNLEDGYVDDNEEAKMTVDDTPKPQTILGRNLEDGYIDDNEEAKPIVVNKPKTQSVAQNTKAPTPNEVNIAENVVGQPEIVDVGDVERTVPVSENQINDPEELPTQDLEKSVLNIVEDSLKAATKAQDFEHPTRSNSRLSESNPENSQRRIEMLPEQIIDDIIDQKRTDQNNLREATPLAGPIQNFERVKPHASSAQKAAPSQANDDKVVKVYEIPKKTETVGAQEPEPEVIAPTSTKLQNRGQFSKNQVNEKGYFGALVPANDLPSGLADPRIKKVYYVGENMNLPLKMIQDENGVMKLQVDTDALCNCENKNCTKKHVDERFRAALTESEEENTELPDLQVRFGRDSHHDGQLIDSFVDSLHNHDENRPIVKRSPKIESDNDLMDVEEITVASEKLEIENEIEKLNEHIERYNKRTEELLNKGTVALFSEAEKAENINKMTDLASSLLVWLKDMTMKKLRS